MACCVECGFFNKIMCVAGSSVRDPFGGFKFYW